MEQFKVGDEVELVANSCHSQNKIGTKGVIERAIYKTDEYEIRPNGSTKELFCQWSYGKDLKLINQNNMDEFKITKERILAAAAKCSTAKATLETMFPEAFQGKWNKIGRFEPIKKNDTVVIEFSCMSDCDIWINPNYEIVPHLPPNQFRIVKK